MLENEFLEPTTSYMKMKRISLLLATCIFILSCGTSKKLVYKDLSVDEMKKKEWVSFNVNTKYYIGKKLFGEYPTSTIVIHKLNDSTMQLAVLERAKTINTSTLLTNEKVILIDDNYQYIATYTPADTIYYAEIVASTLQNQLDFFPMYFPHKYGSQITYPDSIYDFKISKTKDTIYNVIGKMLRKRCYSDGTCELYTSSIELGYSSVYKTFTEAKEVKKSMMLNVTTQSFISNISFDNKKCLLDSIFETTAEQYIDYYKVPNNDFLPNRRGTTNMNVNDTVLNYPLVNVFTGDTICLKEIKGTILLTYFNFGFPFSEIEKIKKGAERTVDNCIWLIPNCTNVARIQEFAKENNLINNVYYAKDFSSYLDGRIVLLNENYKVVGSSQYIIGSVKRWIKKNLE